MPDRRHTLTSADEALRWQILRECIDALVAHLQERSAAIVCLRDDGSVGANGSGTCISIAWLEVRTEALDGLNKTFIPLDRLVELDRSQLDEDLAVLFGYPGQLLERRASARELYLTPIAYATGVISPGESGRYPMASL